MFPAFQFTRADGLPLLRNITKMLINAGLDPWTVTYWLTAASPQTGHTRTPLEIIDSGSSAEQAALEAEAAEDAARRQNR